MRKPFGGTEPPPERGEPLVMDGDLLGDARDLTWVLAVGRVVGSEVVAVTVVRSQLWGVGTVIYPHPRRLRQPTPEERRDILAADALRRLGAP